MSSFRISLPDEFDFDQCLDFLKRSPKEILHRCNERSVSKLIRLSDADVLIDIKPDANHHLKVTFLNAAPTPASQREVKKFIREWFDMETDLKPFYSMAKKDPLLKELVKKFYGYRIIGQPDLFESLVWAVLGQQINLSFAYTLKQRFVENFGEKIVFQDQQYYLFPKATSVSILNDEHLLPLQFSRQKSKYVVLIAEAFASGKISKQKIKDLSFHDAKEELMKIKGIGNWTANYALMKTFRYPDAFPLEDAGLHNAIKNLKGLKAKPTLEQVKRIFKRYKGWEAYATLYLWKSL
jgi:DNA-3-methyladenine glycosylase II